MARLLTAVVVFAFFTIVLGSWVRNAGAGLSCPDWPLCHGHFIPPMEYRIMLEYFHRLAAAGVSLLLLVSLAQVLRKSELRKTIGPWLGVSMLFLVAQIILGKLTVDRLLQWEVVATHLGVAVCFLAALVGATHMAWRLDAAKKTGRHAKAEKNSGIDSSFLWAARLTAAVVFGQILLGGSVSSHYAGLACPDFPTCHGEWWPGFSGQTGIQFLHRLGAVLATLAAAYFLYGLGGAKRKAGMKTGNAYFWLILSGLSAQWLLGIGMIHFGVGHEMTIPAPFSVAHLAIGVVLIVLILWGNYELRAGKLP